MVSFNSTAYATTVTILHWLLKQLLPELGGLPALLIMDLLRSHRTKPVKKLLKKNDVTLSLVPAGCTGIVQPVNISFNRPFKDMLKEQIDKEFEGAVNNFDLDDITGSSAVGEMRIMMTRCVGVAWERFCWEKREVIIRSFRCIGASLPIDGSSGGEISIKVLPTPHLMTALKDWKTQEAPTVDDGTASCSDDTAEDSSSSGNESNVKGQPSASDATQGKPKVCGMSGHGRAGSMSQGRGRGCGCGCGCGKNLASAHLVAPSTTVIATSPASPQAAALVTPGTAESVAHSCSAAPVVGIRRSAMLAGRPQYSHVISFPQITNTEGDEDEDEDGLEYDFLWHRDGF